ncbi:hypothetical protein F5148DRAFT_1268187 [Russula earlei]|uniref:Uncharacterized protein n=1 Tax=Russula earlei TaxID=71964 RepID=A0ACC0TR52_9AGAM|nr:hypothetical protein F5148DRAFT_1268187 [Russula earlei]
MRRTSLALEHSLMSLMATCENCNGQRRLDKALCVYKCPMPAGPVLSSSAHIPSLLLGTGYRHSFYILYAAAFFIHPPSLSQLHFIRRSHNAHVVCFCHFLSRRWHRPDARASQSKISGRGAPCRWA